MSDKLKEAARALARKKATPSSDWMFHPDHHKQQATEEPSWLDKKLVEAQHLLQRFHKSEGPPEGYQRPMWNYDTEGQKKDVKPQTQYIAEQTGATREDVIRESEGFHGDQEPTVEDMTGKKTQLELSKEHDTGYEDVPYGGA